MKALVIGDIHLRDDVAPGYLESQYETVLRICDKENPDQVIFLGDIFHYRKPTPKVLLKVNS